MADDRPADDPVVALAELRREFDDFRATAAAQIVRRPTGDIEPTLRSAAKPGTLLLQGQALSRATYAPLWAWVAEQGLSGAGKPFGAGDGTSTFVLPDLRGRVVSGADATQAVGTLFGANTVALAVANLPAHNHPLTGGINSVGAHDHDVTGSGGDHDAHNYSGTCDPGFNSFPYGHEHLGNHNHPMVWDGAHTHSHNFAVGNTGSGTAVSVVQASIAVNWMIWL